MEEEKRMNEAEPEALPPKTEAWLKRMSRKVFNKKRHALSSNARYPQSFQGKKECARRMKKCQSIKEEKA